MSNFRLRLLLVMVRDFDLRLRPGLAILQLAVSPARVMHAALVVFQRRETEKGSHQAAVGFSFVGRSSLEIDFSFPVPDLFRFRTELVTADLGIAADPSVAAAAGFELVVGFAVAVVAVAGSDSDFVYSAVAAFSFEEAQPSLEALDRSETSPIPQ